MSQKEPTLISEWLNHTCHKISIVNLTTLKRDQERTLTQLLQVKFDWIFSCRRQPYYITIRIQDNHQQLRKKQRNHIIFFACLELFNVNNIFTANKIWLPETTTTNKQHSNTVYLTDTNFSISDLKPTQQKSHLNR